CEMAFVEASHRDALAHPREGVPRECGSGRAQGGKGVHSRQIQQAVDSQSAQAAATGRPGCGNRALTTLQEHAQAFLPPRDEAAAYCCALVRWCRSSAESVN